MADVPQSLASRPPAFALCVGPLPTAACRAPLPTLGSLADSARGGFAVEDTCAWSMGGDGADVAGETLAGASSDGQTPGAEEAPPHPAPRDGERMG